MSSNTSECTLSTCRASTSIYGYRPNLGINVFFAIVYSLITLHCIYIVSAKRKYLAYTISILVGSLFELAGYATRITSYSNPFETFPWTIQYSFLTIAPVFVTAAIYVCIGRIANHLGRGVFNIKPRLYSRTFITSDAITLLVQATGGGLATSAASGSSEGADNALLGQDIIIGGLALQVASLVVLLVLFLGVVWPARIYTLKSRGSTREERKFRAFITALIVAILLIIGRSAFRVAEFSEGISGRLAHDEITFIILDGFPIGIATSLLMILHPLYRLPENSKMRVSSSDVMLPPPAYGNRDVEME
ncbi:RTA1-domain-containing protein [Xylariaceae sp. FL1019]|nr:RTA1-domain-containing protein [Xylariaceae sp. FL1019]